MTLAHRIKAARRQLGREWTQRKLIAELNKAGLKLSYQWLASLESGRVRGLRTDQIKVMAKVLKKPTSYFAEEDLAPAPSGGQDLKPLVEYLMGEVVELKRRVGVLEGRA